MIDLEELKKARKEKKLSYDEIAEVTGLSRSTITNIFCGYIKQPRYGTITAIETALGLSGTNSRTAEDEAQERLLRAYSAMDETMRRFLVEMAEWIATGSSKAACPAAEVSVEEKTK